jgi:hypothetical protein
MLGVVLPLSSRAARPQGREVEVDGDRSPYVAVGDERVDGAALVRLEMASSRVSLAVAW